MEIEIVIEKITQFFGLRFKFRAERNEFYVQIFDFRSRFRRNLFKICIGVADDISDHCVNQAAHRECGETLLAFFKPVGIGFFRDPAPEFDFFEHVGSNQP